MKNSQFKEKYGPYALVAGGSDGLGFAFAEAAAQRGLNLVLIALQAERLHAAAERLKAAYHVDVIVIAADMADFEQVSEQIRALSVSIGLLFYNAAYARSDRAIRKHQRRAFVAGSRRQRQGAAAFDQAAHRAHDCAKTGRDRAEVLACRRAGQPEHRDVCGDKIVQRHLCRRALERAETARSRCCRLLRGCDPHARLPESGKNQACARNAGSQ